MAHLKFSLDGTALEISTRQVIPPHHVIPLREEEEVMVAGELFQTPPGSPAPQEEQAPDAPENSLVKWIIEDAPDPLHAFQEYERYFFAVNSGSDCDAPEDEFTDEMDISSDENQLVPVNLQEEEDPAVQGDIGQLNPIIIPAEDIPAIEENIEPSAVNVHVTLVNVQVTEPEDPSTLRRLDFDIEAFDTVYPEADQEVNHEMQLDVEVQTVATNSATEGESSSSSRILIGIHVDHKPPESKDSFELLDEAVNGNSVDLRDVTIPL